MYFHVMLGASDLEASKRFYDATFGVMDVPSKGQFRESPAAYMYGHPATGLFFITKAQDGQPETHANGGTVMFKAKSVAEVEAWHQAGLANGGSEVAAPKEGAIPGSTMAWLRDPTGNKVAIVALP